MQYHLISTERCNLSCKYCGGTRNIENLPLERSYSLEDLISFINKDPNPIIGFYGGEPLLVLDFLYEVMDNVNAKFTLQTNGLLLNEVKTSYLNKLDAILVSIDGRREVTDYYRSQGTYSKVINNCKIIRKKGYSGDLVARMTFSDNSDIYIDVLHLLNLVNPKFDHVHWQIDVFWSELKKRRNIYSWLNEYDKGITKLVHFFGDELKNSKVRGIVPFIPILKTLLTGLPTPHIRCGSGRNSFAIMSNGRIDVCPIAPELSFSNVGDIMTSNPQDLIDVLPVGEPCSICDIKWICGGRCLFANKTMFWGRPLFIRVCESTRHMIWELNYIINDIKKLIENRILDPSDFDYPKINNGCEIIP